MPVVLLIIQIALFATGDTVHPVRKVRNAKLNQMIDFRIVGGSDASVKDFPYMVSLQDTFNHICGGTIITKLYVLTGAHCITSNQRNWQIVDPIDLNVVAGQSVLDVGECQFRDVKKLYVHSKYDSSTLKNDVALVAIFEPFEWTNYVQAVSLYSSNHISFEDHKYCTATGWGVIEEQPVYSTKTKIPEKNILQKVDLPSSSEKACRKYFAQHHNPALFDETKLCIIISGGKDTCFGDSGGPLICGGIQYGITSFGFGCAQAHMYGIYVNVSVVRNWIYSTVRQTNKMVVTRTVEMVEIKRRFLPIVEKTNFSRNKQNSFQLHTIWINSILIFDTLILFVLAT